MLSDKHIVKDMRGLDMSMFDATCCPECGNAFSIHRLDYNPDICQCESVYSWEYVPKYCPQCGIPYDWDRPQSLKEVK